MLAWLKGFRRFLGAVILPIVISIASFSTASLQAEEDQVLRHAVFFKFKETSSEADVQRIVDAFAALPNKINSIIDFEWGERSSAEKISGGFTHCFLLTFNDEAGREKYLPHPDHKAFGALLKPHLADVFVIDFWGRKAEKAPSRSLRHAVFLSFNKDAKQMDVDKALKIFAGLPDEIKTIKGFEWGTNNSPESHDDGFTHAFLVTFESQADLDAYGPHAAHQALGKALRPIREKVRVLDYWKQ